MKLRKITSALLAAVMAVGISVTAAAEVTPVQTAVVEQMNLSSNVVEGSTKSGLQYRIEDKKVTITGYTGTKSKVTIPSKIKGYPVVAIDHYAFVTYAEVIEGFFFIVENPTLKSIKIPDSVTSIGAGVFKNCINLTSVTIPNGVTSIADLT